MSPMEIARVCHEVHAAYCRAITGESPHPSWDEAPEWQRAAAQGSVGEILEGRIAGPEDLHQNWLETKQAAGWTYSEEKDPEARTHPCMVPFDELPAEQQAKDYLFYTVVVQLAPYTDYGVRRSTGRGGSVEDVPR